MFRLAVTAGVAFTVGVAVGFTLVVHEVVRREAWIRANRP